MLPGEEYAIERWWRAFSSGLTHRLSLLGSFAKRTSKRGLPEDDGAQGIADPHLISSVLLGIIAILIMIKLLIKLVSERSRASRLQRRLRQRGHALISGAPTSKRRKTIDFMAARARLKTRFMRIVGLQDIKAHLTSMLNTLEMDHHRRVAHPGELTPNILTGWKSTHSQ